MKHNFIKLNILYLLFFLFISIVLLIFNFNCQTPSSGGGSSSGGSGGKSSNDHNDETPSIDYSEMIQVSGGTYIQTDGTNSFGHTISDFQIGKYEVTYELWYEVYIWAITNGYNFENTGIEGKNGIVGAAPTPDNHEPVTYISWRDAIVWCNAYSEKSGLTPCYHYIIPTILDIIIKDSSSGSVCDNATCNWSANGYRLPTEGEWQFAASNKGNTPYNFISGDSAPYDTSTTFGNYTWYQNNSSSSTHNVGTKLGNQLGIYDLSGNVCEWCWDWFGEYPSITQTNYRGASSGINRVMRGGAWDDTSFMHQVGCRYMDYPDFNYHYIGFRIARSN